MIDDRFGSTGPDPGHTLVCAVSSLDASRGLKQKNVSCGEWVCVWEVKRYWFALKRASHTGSDRVRDKLNSYIQFCGNTKFKASFVTQTSALYNHPVLCSFDRKVMKSTDIASVSCWYVGICLSVAKSKLALSYKGCIIAVCECPCTPADSSVFAL